MANVSARPEHPKSSTQRDTALFACAGRDAFNASTSRVGTSLNGALRPPLAADQAIDDQHQTSESELRPTKHLSEAIMTTHDEQLLFAAEELVPAPCFLNDRLESVGHGCSVEVPGTLFNALQRSMYAIQTIGQLLDANGVAAESMDNEPLSPFLVGGLVAAVRALSDYSASAMEEAATRHQKARREASHE